MVVSCYFIADVKPGKVLLTSVKALTSFADLCQTSRSWMRSFNTECCSVEDKKRKCQHIVLSILVSVVGLQMTVIECNGLQKSILYLLDSELHCM